MSQILLRVEFIYIALFLEEMINALNNPLRRNNALIWSFINFNLSLAALKIKWGLYAV